MFEPGDHTSADGTQPPPGFNTPNDAEPNAANSASTTPLDATSIGTDPSPEHPFPQDYLLVESIVGISAEIAHLEAERLKVIALLYNSSSMHPAAAPPSAQAEAQQ
jgi:hypothetical protein